MYSYTKNFILIIIILFSSCGGQKGEFAVKKNFDENYRRVSGILEFSVKDRVAWVYHLKKKGNKLSIGIIIMKKEIVWVEIKSTSQRLDIENRTIYGTIASFPSGEYKVVLTDINNDNSLIGEMPFYIYDDEDDWDESIGG